MIDESEKQSGRRECRRGAIALAGVARPTRWHDVIGRRAATARDGDDMVLSQHIGFVPTVRAPVVVGGEDGLPLRGRESAGQRLLSRSTARFSGLLNRASLLGVVGVPLLPPRLYFFRVMLTPPALLFGSALSVLLLILQTPSHSLWRLMASALGLAVGFTKARPSFTFLLSVSFRMIALPLCRPLNFVRTVDWIGFVPPLLIATFTAAMPFMWFLLFTINALPDSWRAHERSMP